MPDALRIRFVVQETLRGLPAKTTDVDTGRDNCGLVVKPGEDWVIYAFPRSDGPGLSTGICTRSRLLKNGANDLSYARFARLDQSQRGRIYGRAVFVEGTRIRPVAGERVALEDEDGNVAIATTAIDGKFEFVASAGSYRIVAKTPSGLTAIPPARFVTLVDGRACAFIELWAERSRAGPGR
jgi:hypothetical protein